MRRLRVEVVMKDKGLVAAWIRRYEDLEQTGSGTTDEGENFAPYQAMDAIVLHDPNRAFDVIVQILENTQNEFVLSNLAAGPLEDLLVRHGIIIIDRVERQAKFDDRFRDLLAGVWRNAISEEVWQRVEKAVCLNRNIQ